MEPEVKRDDRRDLMGSRDPSAPSMRDPDRRAAARLAVRIGASDAAIESPLLARLRLVLSVPAMYDGTATFVPLPGTFVPGTFVPLPPPRGSPLLLVESLP
jgi:hypothetical protein